MGHSDEALAPTVRLFPTACGLVLLLAGAVFGGCSRPSGLRFPGAPVVIICVDTLRADHLPAYGYRAVETPHFDALRRDSILFENAYTHAPLTLPAHVSLFTGLLPFEHGVRDNLGYRLDPKANPMLPVLLKARGSAARRALARASTSTTIRSPLPATSTPPATAPGSTAAATAGRARTRASSCFSGGRTFNSPNACGCGGNSGVVGYVAHDPNAQWVRGREGAQRGVGLVKSKRGDFIGPGNIHTLNLGLYKTTNLGRGVDLRLGVSCANCTNTPSFSLGTASGFPSTVAAQGNRPHVPGTPAFLDEAIFSGSLGQAPYQRIIQLEANLSF